MPIAIYGIKNCDTMKKARAWLDKHGVEYAFHDYKTAGIERAKLEAWAEESRLGDMFNRAGPTFKKLPDKDKQGVTENKAIALMLSATLDDQTPGARTCAAAKSWSASSRMNTRHLSYSSWRASSKSGIPDSSTPKRAKLGQARVFVPPTPSL